MFVVICVFIVGVVVFLFSVFMFAVVCVSICVVMVFLFHVFMCVCLDLRSYLCCDCAFSASGVRIAFPLVGFLVLCLGVPRIAKRCQAQAVASLESPASGTT